MGSGHRGNKKIALRMMGCEVVMATGKLLNSVHSLLLFLPPPAGKGTREEELRVVNKKAGKNVLL